MNERVILTMTFDLEMDSEDYDPEVDYIQLVTDRVEGVDYMYSVVNANIIAYEGDIEEND